ncbi:MAG TPA: cellulose biosynthesis protein CelD [Planctomycetaceae bacterium]|nr:cellulose biosynthesis protein CelD [Planctomycetaceae bacterium]
MITYFNYPIQEFPHGYWERWSDILDEHPELNTPFLRPEFTQIVALVRDDVEIAVIDKDGIPVGFFPYQRHNHVANSPVGRLSESHGAIIDPQIEWNPIEMFKACGIQSWHFDHLPESQTTFSRYQWGTKLSPYVNLSQGYEQYRIEQRAKGSFLSQSERKLRKLEREQGEIRFEWHSSDPHVLQKLIEWKWAQHRRTKVLEIFQHQWVQDLLRTFAESHFEKFSAPLSAMYAGDQLVAVHLGLMSPTNLHLWFPAYDMEFQKYSPGISHMLKLFEAGCEKGITRVDFGPGSERYKQDLKSNDATIAEGMVNRNGLVSRSRGLWYQTKKSLRNSQYRTVLEKPLDMTKQFRQWLAFR